MARILFVAKDNGCASVTEQVAVLARKMGFEVIVIAEGLAAVRFENLGFSLYFKGTKDFRVTPFTLDVNAALRDIQPDTVFVGVGSPNNLGESFAYAADRARIPLFVAEDFWAKSVSYPKMRPDTVLTVDEYAVFLVKKQFPMARVYVVGNPGVYKVEIPEAVKKQIDTLYEEFDEIYVYAGAGPDSTTAELDLLVRCLEKTKGNWCLVPRFHPKYEKFQLPEMKKPCGKIWREHLAPFSERVRYVNAPSTDPIACAADMLVSGFSTLLSTALWNKVPAVCLKTPETVASLKTHGAHYDEIPQVALGLVPAVIVPTDLSQFGMPSKEVLQKLVPYDAQAAYAILTDV